MSFLGGKNDYVVGRALQQPTWDGRSDIVPRIAPDSLENSNYLKNGYP